MKEKRKRRSAASFAAVLLVAVSHMGLLAFAQDEYGESQAPETIAGTAAGMENMMYYTVTIPYHEGCSYEFDEERKKDAGSDEEQESVEENRDIILRYEADEKVDILIKPADNMTLAELHVRDFTDETSNYTYMLENNVEEGCRVEFTMPENDVWLELSFDTVETESEAVTETVTETATEEAAEDLMEQTEQDEPYLVETDQEEETLPVPEQTDPLQYDTDWRAETEPAQTEPAQTEPVQKDAVLVETEAETDTDGLPLQGSIVQMPSITIPFDTWEFDPYNDLRGITYDGDHFSIEFISDNIIYDEAGIYDCIYRVKDTETGKFWFVLRPVVVSEETAVVPQSEPETEPQTELQPEELEETGTEPVTEPETKEPVETETESESEAAERTVKIVVKDASTGNPLGGVQFQVLGSDGGVLLMPDNPDGGGMTDTFTSDDEGTILLTEALSTGTYTLKEVKVPEGYLLADQQEFTIGDEDDGEMLVLECLSEPQTGSILIHKTDTDGLLLGEGFTFEIMVAEDITDPAGTIRTMTAGDGSLELRAGTVVATVSTSAEGIAAADNLYPGSYSYREIASADHYAADTGTYPVVLPYQEDADKAQKDITVANGKTAFDLFKVDSEPEGEKDIPIAGVSFCIFTTKDMGEETAERVAEILGKLQDTAGNDRQQREALLEELTGMNLGKTYMTDESGHIRVSNLEHGAVYYVYEMAALPGYNRDTGLYQFEVDEQGLIGGNPGQSMKIAGTANLLDIKKTDSTGEKVLADAKLILRDTEGRIIDEWTSAEEPHRIKGLAAGEYTLSETQAPDGYALAEDITFTLEDSMEIRQITMKDELLTVSFQKLDESRKTAVAGAHLAVLDSSGKKLAEWVTEESAHQMNLPAGRYRLEELKAPEKYAKADPVEFEVTADKASMDIIMYSRMIRAAISKQDITNNRELEGARLILRNAEGTEIDKWKSGTEPHVMNLAAGKYVLVEETAPEGYEVAEKMEFEVTDSMDLQTFTMFDTPKEKKIDLTGKKHSETKSEGGNTPVPGGDSAGTGNASTGTAVTAANARTGDFNRYLPAAIVIIAGAAGLAAAAILRKKHKGQ